ncbi:putative zona pellucida (ZP) domain protein [Trypoxylus dichotomus]
MRLHAFILFVLLYQKQIQVSKAEDVDVIEAVPSTEELNEHPKATDREDESPPDPADVIEASPHKGHHYNSPPRGGGPARGNNHGKPFEKDTYNGPPPPLPPKQAMDKYGTVGDTWPTPVPDMPQIISLDVKCEKNLMKVYLGFDKPFYGIVFSKGYYSNIHCIHLPAGLGRTSAHFEIGIHACGTTGNTENGLYGYGAESGSGTYFENIIVVQYDPQVQEVWDQARKLRCTWHDQYEKSVTFRPFPVDMLDVIRTDFAGDNVGCWMQIQVGKGPWAAEVSGLVKIGQTMTMVLAIKDDDSKFDMLVRNCRAHDGKRTPIQLVDQKGCVTRPKLMSRFTKIKNFGPSASVLSYANFQAFKFPDSMEVHFQCTIQICRHHCPDQCSDINGLHGLNNGILEVGHSAPENVYGPPPPPPLAIDPYLHAGRPRDERRARRAVGADPETEVGVNRVIRVVSTGDLTFTLDDNNTSTTAPTIVFPAREELIGSGLICMTTPGFAATLVILLAILIVSCLLSAFLCVKLRPFSSSTLYGQNFTCSKEKKSKSCFYS